MTYRPTRRGRETIRVKDAKSDKSKETDKPKESDRPKKSKDLTEQISISYRTKQKQKTKTSRRTRVRVKEKNPRDEQTEAKTKHEQERQPETKTPKEKGRQTEKKSAKAKEPQSETKTPQKTYIKETKQKEVKREKERPDPKKVDAMVKKIAKDYDKRMKETGNVDLWGRPAKKLDEGKLRREITRSLQETSPKEKEPAIKDGGQKQAGSLSKAIGKKFAKKLGSVAGKATGKIKDSGRDDKKRKPGQKEPKERLKSERSVKGVTEKHRKKRHLKSSESRSGDKSLEDKRLGPKLNMRLPEVAGETIRSKERLHELLNGEYSGLKKIEGFPKYLRLAEAHIEYYYKFADLERLPYGEVPMIARELEVDSETIRKQVAEGVTPKLYDYMNRCVTKSEAREILKTIEKNNNGIDNMTKVQKRLDHYYFGEDERKAKTYPEDLEKTEKYFNFLEEFSEGGLKNDIAKRVGLSKSGGREYLDGRRPWPVRLASQIHDELPEKGKVWIPLETTGWGIREKFVPIPKEIETFQDIRDTLSQLSSLEGSKMEKWKQEFGAISKEEAFMYSLGMFVSDSGVQSASKTTQSFILPLSEKYDWSAKVGEGVCYYLGKLGLDIEKKKSQKASTDVYKGRTITRKAKHVWKGNANTIYRWMWKSALGYEGYVRKSDQKLNADWILKAPKNMRIAFLQGLSDGDGSASIKGQYLCITSKSNTEFIKNLFGTFGVKARITGSDIIPSGYIETKKAAAIPMFRFSTERLQNSMKIVKMIDARRDIRKNPALPQEVDFMVKKWNEGLSILDIHVAVFDEFGTTINRYTIERLIQKRIKKKENDGEE